MCGCVGVGVGVGSWGGGPGAVQSRVAWYGLAS